MDGGRDEDWLLADAEQLLGYPTSLIHFGQCPRLVGRLGYPMGGILDLLMHIFPGMAMNEEQQTAEQSLWLNVGIRCQRNDPLRRIQDVGGRMARCDSSAQEDAC